MLDPAKRPTNSCSLSTVHMQLAMRETPWLLRLRSAAARGFDVFAVTDAHTTADRPHLSAEKIIEHHHWMWEHLSLPKGRTVTLLTTDALLEATQPELAC